MSAIEKINDIVSLKRFVPLNELEHDKLHELIENASVLQFKKGQPIFSAIEKNHTVYLLSGNVVRAPNSDRAMLIKAGDSQARHAIMTPGNRSRMVAGNSVTVLCVDAELLDLLLNWGADDGLVVDEIDTDEANEWVDGLLQSEAILSLSPQSIQMLMSVVEPLELNANEVVFYQGDEPDYYYIVSSGHCVVSRSGEGAGATTELARLKAGDAFGEEALIANSVRSATVRMVEDGLLLRLDQRNFKSLLEESLVNNITVERAKSLKERGAEYLDLRSASAFSRDGTGINIPFSELRSRIESLDRNKKYIVVSDDNNVSAVGAFLLSKKRFKVYLLKTAAIEGNAAKTDAESERSREMELFVSGLQNQLQEVTAKLEEEKKFHAASKTRIQLLETGLKKTESSAKKAIVEAGALKSSSESSLREKIKTLTSELEKEKQNTRDLDAINQQLNNDLQSVYDRIEQVQNQAESISVAENEAKTREAELGGQVDELQQKLEFLQQDLERVLAEKEGLLAQLDEARELAGQRADELNQVQAQLQCLSETAEKGQQKISTLSAQLGELETRIVVELTEKQSLKDQLISVNQNVERQTNELSELRNELDNTSTCVEQTEQELQQTQQLLRQQENTSAERERVITQLSDDMQMESHLAQQKHDSLLQKIESKEAMLAEKQTRFSQLESEYQQQIDQLGAELTTAVTETQQLSEQLSKQELRNEVIRKELSMLQQENKRSGLLVKALLFVLVLLVAGIGAAYYMGIDLHDQASVLMEKTAPRFNQLLDAIPGSFRSGN